MNQSNSFYSCDFYLSFRFEADVTLRTRKAVQLIAVTAPCRWATSQGPCCTEAYGAAAEHRLPSQTDNCVDLDSTTSHDACNLSELFNLPDPLS